MQQKILKKIFTPMKLFFSALIFSDYCCATTENAGSSNQYLNKIEIESFSDLYKSNMNDELISYIIDKEICSLEDLDKTFCINLQLGHSFFNVIYLEIKKLINVTGYDFSLFLLKRCIEKLVNDDALNAFYITRLETSYFDPNIGVSVNKDSKFNNFDKKRLHLIFFSIYRYKNTDTLQKLYYNDATVHLFPIHENKNIWYEFFNAYCAIQDGTPSIILSEFMRKHIKFIGDFFQIIYNMGIREDIYLSEIFANPKVLNFIKNSKKFEIEFLKKLISMEVYQDYWKFKFYKLEKEGDNF